MHQQAQLELNDDLEDERAEVSLWSRKNKLPKHKFYSWIQVNPISRQSNGLPLNSLVIAADTNVVYLYDIYGNRLFSFDVAEEITAIRGSPT